MKIIIAAAVFLLSGCAGVVSYIPSFWDPNQSAKITDLRLDVERLDCKKPQEPQVQKIYDDLRWFHLYSDSKGPRQTDVVNLVKPMEDTVSDFLKRVTSPGHKDNTVYCELKKRVMTEQAARAAKAVLGRF